MFSMNAEPFGLAGGLRDRVFGPFEFLLLWNRHHDQDGTVGAQLPRCGDNRCSLSRTVYSHINRQAARP